MWVGDRIFQAELKERGQARADYNRAIARGLRAALLEENRSETFSMKVGNIGLTESDLLKLCKSAFTPLASCRLLMVSERCDCHSPWLRLTHRAFLFPALLLVMEPPLILTRSPMLQP